MNSAEPPIAVERGIATLIADSISLAIQSEEHDNLDDQNTLARASIISSALFLEASANACIDLLNLGPRFADEVDRLPTISKLDLFLHIKPGRTPIDRSRNEYQGFNELKALRDSFVHPRAQKYEWLEWSEDASVSTCSKSKSLGLARIPSYCCSDDAVIALRAAHRFAGYFFKDCGRFRPSQVSALFHSEAVVPNLREKTAPVWSNSMRSWLRGRDIDVSYMRVHWCAG